MTLGCEMTLLLYRTLFIFFASVLWNPSGNGNQVVTVCEQHLELWDLDRSASTAEVCCQEIKQNIQKQVKITANNIFFF